MAQLDVAPLPAFLNPFGVRLEQRRHFLRRRDFARAQAIGFRVLVFGFPSVFEFRF
jgi:hypothetical protein